MYRIVLFLSRPGVLRFLIRLFSVLAVLFGGLVIFAAVVPWAKPVMWIAIANLVMTSAMAVMNSIVLDKVERKP